MRRVRSAVLGLLVVATLAACAAPAPGPSPAQTSDAVATTAGSASAPPSTPSDSGPSSAAPSASVSATAGDTSDADRSGDQCSDSVIRVSLSTPEGSAGSFDQDLVFTNTGDSGCVLRGAPGLSVVGDGNGTQIGAAAARDQEGARTVRLGAHGGKAYAPFTGPELGPGSEGAEHCSGGVRSGDGYRVYPPHSTRAVFVRNAHAAACPTGGAFLRVGVVRPVGTP